VVMRARLDALLQACGPAELELIVDLVAAVVARNHRH
jgi:hypothetical protein